jgi:hypothetical protein
MDGLGRLFFEGDEISHPRVLAFLRRCLDVSDSGEVIVRIEQQWAYLRVGDLPLRANRIVPVDGAPQLVLDDGRSLPLDPSTLWEEPERGLRCTAPSYSSKRPLGVRFTNSAQMDLDRWIEWVDGVDRPFLIVGEQRTQIPDRPPPPRPED